MKAITASPFPAGISNQKIALVGLLLAAQAEGCRAVLPPLLDYVPGAADQRQRSVEEIFDMAALRQVSPVEFATAPTETRDPVALFHATMATLQDAQLGGKLLAQPAVRLLAALQPTPVYRAEIAAAAERFRQLGGSLVCQMRIEPDWAKYVGTRLVPRLGETQDLTLSPLDIGAKIVATLTDAIGPVLVTCDLERLPCPPAALAVELFDRCGLRILFKTDLGAPSGASPLEASLFDFELMAQSSLVAGTTLSSFFGLAVLTRFARTGHAPEAWAYNAPGASLARRTDNGVFANVARATAVG